MYNQASVIADSQSKEVKVETQVSESSVRNAIADAGYSPIVKLVQDAQGSKAPIQRLADQVTSTAARK